MQAGLVASMKSKVLILLLGMLSVCGWTQEGTGIMYNDGKGVVKDQKEAISTLTKSSEQGDPYAQYILGGCYMVGQGVDKNEREAVDLWTKSASQGNADAQCILGICYKEGKGVVKNQGEAIKLWTKSAAQGNTRAKEELEKIKLK